MKKILSMVLILTAMILLAQPEADQKELPNPGITPDSPFYFLDRIFDVFKSPKAQADERAAEMVAMEHKGDEEGLGKAREGYKKAMEKRQKEAEKDEEIAEEVVRQSSKHLAVLARIREKVSEKTKAGVDRALAESAKGRENALSTLKEKNPERAGTVARETLQRVMEKAPEQALPGLRRALEAGRKGEPKEESGKSPKADTSKAKEDKEKTEKGQKSSDQQEGGQGEEESVQKSQKQSGGTNPADFPKGKAGKKQ